MVSLGFLHSSQLQKIGSHFGVYFCVNCIARNENASLWCPQEQLALLKFKEHKNVDINRAIGRSEKLGEADSEEFE